MKKIIVLLSLVISLSFSLNAEAGQIQSLDEITKNSSTETTQEAPKDDTSNSDETLFDSMYNTVDLTEKQPQMKKIEKDINPYVALVLQILVWAITVGVTGVALLDFLYIVIPPARKLLSGGNMGIANQGQQQQGNGMGGFGGGFGGGMGGMGGGAFNRFGGGGFDRFGGGMGGGMNGQQQQGMQTDKICFVSNSALNAVACEKEIGPDGKSRNALKIWGSQMIVLLIAVPILLVLSSSGVLFQFGLAIGEVLMGLIRSVGNGFRGGF